MNNIHQEHRRPWGVAPAPERQPRLLVVVERVDRDDHSEPVALSGGLPHELAETWAQGAWVPWAVGLAAVALGLAIVWGVW